MDTNLNSKYLVLLQGLNYIGPLFKLVLLKAIIFWCFYLCQKEYKFGIQS